MSGAVRSVALLALVVTLALWTAPQPAAALNPAGTLCSLTGLVSGILGKACTVATHAGRVLRAGQKLIGGHLGGAIGALSASSGVTRAATAAVGLAAIATAVTGGARSALRATTKVIAATTSPNLRGTWFSAFYWRMAAVAALLTVPFLFAAAIQAMIRSDLALLARAVFGYLPLGLLAVGVAAPLTMLLLAGSDEMSAIVASASGNASADFLDRAGGLAGGISGASGDLFVMFLVGLLTAAATITLWVELLIRQAAVYVIVLMLPLFFAALVWPARRIWAARAVELLVALILSKFAIVSVLALGGAALGHAPLPGAAAFLTGATLVLLAAFTPWALLRLLPLHELAGAAAGGLSAAGRHSLIPALQRTDSRADAATRAVEQLPARLLALTPPGSSGDDDAALGEAEAGRTPAAATDPAVGTAAPSDAGAGDDTGAAASETPTANGGAGGAAPDERAEPRGPLEGVLAAPANTWRPMDLGTPDELLNDRPLVQRADDGGSEAGPAGAARRAHPVSERDAGPDPAADPEADAGE